MHCRSLGPGIINLLCKISLNMRHIIRMIPAIALAAFLSGCEDNHSSTSTITIDSAALNESPKGNATADQTGGGISQGTPTGAATTNSGSTNISQSERSNRNATGTNHQRIKNQDSMDGQHGMTPPR
jgi:hypothetical protein